MGIETTAMVFAVGERDQPELQIQQGKVGIYRQGAVQRTVDGKLLRGNIKGKGDSGETDLTGFLLKTARAIRHYMDDGGG